VICRAGIAAVFIGLMLVGGAEPAESDPPATVSSYYLGRPDPRLCPSPICGGVWVRLVNKRGTTCGDGGSRTECYVASIDLGRLRLNEATQSRLTALFTEGRALARGALARGRVDGFPDLDTLVVTEAWPASSSRNRAGGVFHRLRDNGVRCVTTPCFSIHAAVLNTARHIDVSGVDVSAVGASAAERRRALTQLAKGRLAVAGRIVRRPNRGFTKAGRTFLATQFYVRTSG
jgi:hypothetical protein